MYIYDNISLEYSLN